MRIHRLSLRAFGPFPGTVELDFDDLNRAGLFLLTGETGAGKSTVLEAVCFALYGQTTVSENSKSLKSAWAAETTAPQVEMEFSVGSWRYLVTRSPEWLRPARRRTKNPWQKEQARVSLSRVPQERASEDPVPWESLSVRLPEAAAHIEAVLGLNRAQFEQVVMLPQGRFAQFLEADSGQRETLLKKLFSTTVFDHALEVFKERAQHAEQLAQEADGLLRRTREELMEETSRLEAITAAEELGTAEAGSVEQTDGASGAADVQQRPSGASAGAQEQDGEDAAAEELSLPELLEQAIAQVQEAVTAAEHRRRSSRGALARAREQLQELDQLLEDWAEHRRLLGLQQELEHDQQDRDRRSSALESARAAAPVVQAADRFQAASARTREAAEQTEAARGSFTALLPGSWEEWPWSEAGSSAAGTVAERAAAGLSVAELAQRLSAGAPEDAAASDGAAASESAVHEAWEDVLATCRSLLDSARQRRADLHRLQEQAGQAQQEAEAARQREEDFQEALDQQQEQHSRLATERDAAAQEVSEAADASSELERAQEQLDLSLRLKDLREQLQDAMERAQACESRRQRAAQAVDELMSQRFRQAAGLLAADLQDHQPCPVCGSTEHPAPSRPPAAAETEAPDLSEQAVQQAQNHRAEAEARAEQAQQDLVSRQAQSQALRDRGVPEDPESARKLVQAAEQALAASQQRRQALLRLEHQLAETEEAVARHREHRDRARVQAATARARAQQLQLSAQRQEEAIAAVPSEERLENLQQHIEELVAAGRGLRRAQQEHRSMAAASTSAGGQLQEALASSGLAGEEQARAQALDPARTQELAQQVQQDHDRLVSWQAAWDHPRHLAHLQRIRAQEEAQEPSPSVREQAVQCLHRAEESSDRAVAAASALENLRSRILALQDRSRGLEGQAMEQVQQAARLRDLSEVAHGNGSENTLRMSLTTYVLAAELEEVAQAASVRLGEMTGGRYSIHHTDEKASRGRKSGLGLEVFDAWTSQSRATSTLSGGESFMASLCLALGLADVVQSRAGGIDVDTLFVDEGFGSLDEATLEQVMDAVDGLRENGRVIGLVSHVADMKSRIPKHVRIRRSPTGSTVEQTSA